MADSVLKARDNGVVFDIGATRPGGGYAVASLDESVLAKVAEVLVELQGKLEAGQAVALDAATLAALETVNANITNQLTVGGTVELGTTTLAALETINASVTGTVSVANALALDTATLAALESVTATISGTVTVNDGHPDPQLDGLTNAQLRATPVPVSTGLTTQTDALTNTQLRATPVPVSTGLTTQTDALTNTQLRASNVSVTDASQVEGTGYLNNRYSGGKSAVVATVTAAGNTTILTPGAGNRLEIYWVYAITTPTSTGSTLIKVSLGTTEIYRTYAVAHWEKFVGAPDESLIVNLSESDSVAVTVHYKEVTP